MKHLKRIATFFLIAGLVFASCKKEKIVTSGQQAIPVNHAPVSNAGPNRFVLLPGDSVLLSGRGSDVDGHITGFRWQKKSGPGSPLIVQPFATESIVRNLVEGCYEFELTVSDNGGLTAKDVMIVVVGLIDPCFGCWDY